MKAGPLFFAALVAAQPQRLHHRHQHKPRADVVFEVVTDVEVAEVTIFVDQYGHTLSTGFAAAATTTHFSAAALANLRTKPTSTTSSSTKPTTSSTRTTSSTTTSLPPPKPVSTSTSTTPTVAPFVFPTTLIQVTTSAPVAAPPASSSVAPAPSSAPSTGGNGAGSGSSSGLGLTYSPYLAAGGCKSQDQINNEFQTIFSQGNYGTIRLYGSDCDQVSRVLQATASKGTKLFLGIYNINNVEAEAAAIVSAVGGDWSRISTVSVGNELVNNGQATVDQIRSAVARARSALTGYTGPVVTVDTFVAIINNPGLCDVGDYVAANCHAFFDGGILAAGAGAFVVAQAQRVSAACGGKKTVITESGWPSGGIANKLAIPGLTDQQTAIASLKAAFTDNLFLFTAFNDGWKTDSQYTFGAEKFWGIFGSSAA